MEATAFLARHGATAWNKEQRLQGSKDIPLAESGIKQAHVLAEELSGLSINRIVTSNLQRAYQTADIIGKRLGVAVEKEKGFNERSYGKLEGRIWPEVKKELELSHESLETYAEPFSDFSSRVIDTFSNVLMSHENQRILIVCHGGVLRILLEHLRKTPSLSGNIGYELPNASAYVFTRKKDQWIEKTLK